jgi:hypothetical protein
MQPQLERAAVRLSRLGLFKLDCISWEGIWKAILKFVYEKDSHDEKHDEQRISTFRGITID